MQYLEHHNADPKPFIWTKSAGEILEKVAPRETSVRVTTLVFDDDNFNEDETFLLTDWLAHTPTGVLAKNFGVPESAFANIPSEELYIFKSEVPGPETPSNLSVVISESPASPG